MIAFGPPPLSTIVSPTLTAGMPQMKTDVLPMGTIPPTCGTKPLTRGQTCISDTLQAGKPPISTVGAPGPGAKGMPCDVRSPNLAAGGIINH